MSDSNIIHTARGAVECAISGDGNPVFALHGAMGGYDQGVLLVRTTIAEPGYRYIVPSRPGYLRTPLALGRTPEEQADLYAALLDALTVPKTAVIAISGGGQSALQFALRHPDRCTALIMISACSAPIQVRLPLRFYFMKVMAHIPPLAAGMRRKLEADPERAAQRAIPDPALRARTLNDPEVGPLFKALQLSTTECMKERLPGTLNDIRHSRLPFAYPLERIAVPTLVVHGTADQAAPYAQAKALAAAVPGAELLTIEGGEHVSIFTHRAEIRARICAFLGATRSSHPASNHSAVGHP
jgi:pimeloyl-ACP methyl ester carboxylesterase